MDVLKVEGVSKEYDNKLILDNIDINIKKGEFVTILGPSGCGKSTLFKIINGLDKIYLGSCRVEGVEGRDYKNPIAYMPQKDLLLPWRSLFDNASLPLEIGGIKKEEFSNYINPLLEDFGLKGFENHYPKELSGGMRQRAALLRTFLINSDLMLLDEPFGALDAITRKKMQEWLMDIWGKHKHTVLFITHDIEEAIFLSDKVYVMSKSPAKILDEIKIEFPRPRNKDITLTEEFLVYKRKILEYLDF